jgi:hypothetical protein
MLGSLLSESLKTAAKQASKKAAQKSGTLQRVIDEEGLDLEEIREAYKVQQRKEQVPSVAKAASDLDEGIITKQEYDKVVKKDNPILPIIEMPEVPSLKRIEAVLGNKVNKTGIVGKNINPADLEGKRISSRLDIPAYNNYDTWVVTLHEPKAGKVLGYGQTSYLKDVEFHVPKDIGKQTKGMKIAKGGAKNPYAAIDGTYTNVSPEEAYAVAARELNNPDSQWTQIGMNPHRHSYFYDKATGEPVLSADEVIQVGPLVLGRGIKKGDPKDFKFKAGGSIERNPYNYTSRAI